MPSKTHRTEMPFSRDPGAVDKAMQGVAELAKHCGGFNEKAISSMFQAARNGSEIHISKVGWNMKIMPEIHIAEAVSIMCSVLDVPAFPPNQALPASLASTRSLAYDALQSLSQIPKNYNFDESSPLNHVLMQNWPAICNWMQYFIVEFARSHDRDSSLSTFDLLQSILNTAPGIINNFSRCGEVFGRLVLKDDDILNLLIKTWLELNLSPSHPFFSGTFLRCLSLLDSSLLILHQNDDGGTRMAEVSKYVFFEAGEDTGMVSKKLLRHIKDPSETCKQNTELVVSSLNVVLYLTEDRASDKFAEKILDSSLENQLIPLLIKLLLFISDQLTSKPGKRILSATSAAEMMRSAFWLVLRTACSRNGQYWTARLFDLGFLRAIACILSSDHVIDGLIIERLTQLFGIVIPGYLCHRFVFRSAVKAVKEISITGAIKSVEVSFLRDDWMTFTNMLLERTVLNAVFERDYSDADIRKCENCGKLKKNTSLFKKCADCLTVMYCSRECQKASWKRGDHKSNCEKGKQMWHLSGMTMSKVDLTFLDIVALAELRRHLPGISKRLATYENPSGIPLSDAFFSVCLLSLPPTIKVSPSVQARKRGASESEEGEPEERSISRNGLAQPRRIEIESFWGGRAPLSLTHRISPNVQLFPLYHKYGGDDKVADARFLLRKPAQDEHGKALKFTLDDIDKHVMHARKYFKPPPPGDKKSPKTIYDYVEARVEADPSTMSWLSVKNPSQEDWELETENIKSFFLRHMLLSMSL